MKVIFKHGKYKLGVESNRNIAAEILSGTLKPKLNRRVTRPSNCSAIHNL